jgi:pyrroline-5-carboxylate reductase
MDVGFAGSGNMAAAMARGWAAADGSGPDRMLFADSGSGRAAELAAELGETAVGSLAELAEQSDLIVLAVKPKALAEAAAPIAGNVAAVISVLGATPLAQLTDVLSPTPVLRAMPNLAVEIGRGVICHAPVPAGASSLAPALGLLDSLGTVFELDEGLLDPATAVMGCAPAYLALACEALIDAGAEAGIDPRLSARLVSEAAAGLGLHQLERDPRDLQDAIASPGGSTEAGLDSLKEADVPQSFKDAVTASLERMTGTR